MPIKRPASYLQTVEIPRSNLDTRSKGPAEERFYTGLVPLQGHWEKVNTPLRQTTPRERLLVRIVLGVLGVAAIATVIVAIVTSGNGTSGAALGPGCIRVELPSTMGGSSSDLCGNTAREFCLSAAANSEPLDTQVQPKCRDEGYPIAPQ